VLGLDESYGEIRPGGAADLVGFATNPLTGIATLAPPSFVMRAGAVVGSNG
jgi:imidazolonepropionase-like amidohydrolase